MTYIIISWPGRLLERDRNHIITMTSKIIRASITFGKFCKK